MACVSRLILHSFIHFLRSEYLLVVGKSDAHPLTDRVRIFALKRHYVGQKGFKVYLTHIHRLLSLKTRQAGDM